MNSKRLQLDEYLLIRAESLPVDYDDMLSFADEFADWIEINSLKTYTKSESELNKTHCLNVVRNSWKAKRRAAASDDAALQQQKTAKVLKRRLESELTDEQASKKFSLEPTTRCGILYKRINAVLDMYRTQPANKLPEQLERSEFAEKFRNHIRYTCHPLANDLAKNNDWYLVYMAVVEAK